MNLDIFLDVIVVVARLLIHYVSHATGIIKYLAGVPFDTGYTSSTTAIEIAQRYNKKLNGKVAIVTGSTSGLGLETVRALTHVGVKTILTYRSPKKLDTAMKRLEADPDARTDLVIPLQLELTDIESIQNFVEEFKKLALPLHYLVNNAGVLNKTRKILSNGYEMTFFVNHIATYYLTELLLPILKATGADCSAVSRIVYVNSTGQLMCPREGIVLDNLSLKDRYRPFVAYGHSKLAGELYMLKLQADLKKQGARVTTNSANPGAIPSTGIDREMDHPSFWKASDGFLFFKTMGAGAATNLYALTDERFETEGGLYLVDCHEVNPIVGFNADMQLANKLCAKTEAIVSRLTA